ncbi:MAG TPA: cytochrome d ubiquinol oxidase subunit II [Pseudoclavibacter sp.]|nr:cytochrome d ubiquinol oxidase subunit II [Pseudoclavibacter sp.]
MDLNTLHIVWFLVVGVLFVGYFVLDGFDFGVGMSLPFLGKDDVGRRQIINTIGSVWDMNETWLIVAGACLFAGFPEWYATLFSGAYLALFLILIALIARGVSFEYRHQGKGEKWTKWFDGMIVFGSVVPALLWGVAVADIVHGLPIEYTGGVDGYQYTGIPLLSLLTPYGLLGGVTTLLLFFTHGVHYVALKTDGQIKEDAHKLAFKLGIATIVVAASFLLWTVIAHFSVLVLLCALIAAVALISAVALNYLQRDGWAFTMGVVTVVFAVLTLWMVLLTSYSEPMVMPSTVGSTPEEILANSLTLSAAGSTLPTMQFMLWVAAFALPVVLCYQAWTFWVFRKRVTRASIEKAAAVAH